MKIELPKLPFEMNALEPNISAKTLEFHYGKHHQAYMTNLNNLIQGTKFENASLETMIKEAEGPIFNNAAQVLNHTFYFSGLQQANTSEPGKQVAEAIKSSFGSQKEFKDAFIKAASTLFGSGWVWLIKDSKGTLEIIQESNAGNPIRKGLKPILTCDVWEHAYYLDYQNRRPDYLNAYWDLIDWDVVEKRF
ncbi:MAG: superoxide dismutase [Mariniphaga sp.]|nr:superoxide dismutase [Mariniphaga sp.]